MEDVTFARAPQEKSDGYSVRDVGQRCYEYDHVIDLQMFSVGCLSAQTMNRLLDVNHP